MDIVLHAAPAGPRRPLAAARRLIGAFLSRRSAARRFAAVEHLNESQMRDIGLDPRERAMALRPRLWSNWLNAPRHPFGL